MQGIRLSTVTLGAPDPVSLARFYARLLGWQLGRRALPVGLAPHWRTLLMGCWRWLAPLLIGGILVRGLV